MSNAEWWGNSYSEALHVSSYNDRNSQYESMQRRFWNWNTSYSKCQRFAVNGLTMVHSNLMSQIKTLFTLENSVMKKILLFFLHNQDKYFMFQIHRTRICPLFCQGEKDLLVMNLKMMLRILLKEIFALMFQHSMMKTLIESSA